MFYFAQLLKLVELVREEPMLFPPPHGSLYNVIRSPDTGRIRAMHTMRRIFRLSSIGKEDEKSWCNLTRAWKEQWSAPQKMDIMPSTDITVIEKLVPTGKELKIPKEKVEGKRGRKKKVITAPVEIQPEATIPAFEWEIKPSQKQYGRLLKHLGEIDKLDQTREDVIKHIDDLTTRIGDWAVGIDDALEDAKTANNTRLIGRLSAERKLVNDVYEGFIDRELGRAIKALSKLIRK
jgi:hypothetical protein